MIQDRGFSAEQAIDVWLMVCFLFSVTVLVEFCVIVYFCNRQSKHASLAHEVPTGGNSRTNLLGPHQDHSGASAASIVPIGSQKNRALITGDFADRLHGVLRDLLGCHHGVWGRQRGRGLRAGAHGQEDGGEGLSDK